MVRGKRVGTCDSSRHDAIDRGVARPSGARGAVSWIFRRIRCDSNGNRLNSGIARVRPTQSFERLSAWALSGNCCRTAAGFQAKKTGATGAPEQQRQEENGDAPAKQQARTVRKDQGKINKFENFFECVPIGPKALPGVPACVCRAGTSCRPAACVLTVAVAAARAGRSRRGGSARGRLRSRCRPPGSRRPCLAPTGGRR